MGKKDADELKALAKDASATPAAADSKEFVGDWRAAVVEATLKAAAEHHAHDRKDVKNDEINKLIDSGVPKAGGIIKSTNIITADMCAYIVQAEAVESFHLARIIEVIRLKAQKSLEECSKCVLKKDP